MRRLSWVSFLITLGALLSCCGTYSNTQEAEVYRSYINARLIKATNTQQPYDMIVINDRTSGWQSSESLQEAVKKLSQLPDQETMEDFLIQNGRYFGGFSIASIRNGILGRRSLNPDLRFQIKHELISDATRDQIFGQSGWKEFYKRYPNCRGMVDLSRVGFNKNKTEALLYVGNQWDYTAGVGCLVLLEKKDSEWKVVDRAVIWVS